MAADDGGGGCKTSSSSLRWLCLARCAVSLVVGVLAAVILVKAVSLILHPNKFHLRVSGKFLVERQTNLFACRFYLRAENRREHAFIYYRNVTVKLIDGQGAAPAPTTIMQLNLSAEVITLMPGQVQEYYFPESVHPLNETYVVQALFSDEKQSQSIADSTVELDGELTNGGHTYRASYVCAPVTIVRGSDIRSLPSASAYGAASCIPTVFF